MIRTATTCDWYFLRREDDDSLTIRVHNADGSGKPDMGSWAGVIKVDASDFLDCFAALYPEIIDGSAYVPMDLKQRIQDVILEMDEETATDLRKRIQAYKEEEKVDEEEGDE